MLLLSKYLRPRHLNDHFESQSWSRALGEPVKNVVLRFLSAGYIAAADLNYHVDQAYRVRDLKDMLLERGLPTAGKKAELVSRLIGDASEMVRDQIQYPEWYQCSDAGRPIAEHYLGEVEKARVLTTKTVVAFLKERKYYDACRAIDSFESTQVFPNPVGSGNWSRNVLASIFEISPAILRRMQGSVLDDLRLAAALKHLWGTDSVEAWLPTDFDTGVEFDAETAVRMMNFAAMRREEMSQYRALGFVLGVEILSAQNCCEQCKAIHGKRYSLDDAPELPYENCTHAVGCRCVYLAIMKE